MAYPYGMECVEKARLTEAVSAATQKYGECLKDLYERMGKLSQEEYREALRQCDELRDVSEQARHHLHTHIAKHGC